MDGKPDVGPERQTIKLLSLKPEHGVSGAS